MEYSSFSEFYDKLMCNVDYERRAEYVMSLFRKFDKTPSLLLDLACGTGNFTRLFKTENTDVIGVDPSVEMLNIARQKSPQILFLNQSAEELDLFGTVDGAVCLMDSLNHITEYENFKKALCRVSLFLEKGRLFIFDLNTQYKHNNILANNAFVYEEDDVFCVWQNQTEDSLTDIYLDFFIKNEKDMYLRECEEFSERAYSKRQVVDAVNASGLRVEAIYEELSLDEPADTSQRVFYVTRKV